MRITVMDLERELKYFAEAIGKKMCDEPYAYPEGKDASGYLELEGYSPTGFGFRYRVGCLDGTYPLGELYHTKSEMYLVLQTANRAIDAHRAWTWKTASEAMNKWWGAYPMSTPDSIGKMRGRLWSVDGINDEPPNSGPNRVSGSSKAMEGTD